MKTNDIVDRFCDSRDDMYELLFKKLVQAVVERCAETAEATQGITHDTVTNGRTQTVACGCGARIAATIRSAA